jgi:hypothetical protein
MEISPRYANYRSAAGVLRTAIITTSTIFGALPNPLTVAGVSYTLGNAQGESTLPYLPAYNMAAMGPQGAQGPQGSGLPLTTDYQALGADVSLSPNVLTNIVSSDSLASGTWLLIASANIVNALSSNQTAAIKIATGTATASVLGGSGEASTLASNGEVQLTTNAIVTITAAGTIKLQAEATNTAVVKASTTHYTLTGTYLIAVKIG